MLIVYTLTDGELRGRDSRAEELIAQMSRGDVEAMGGLYELIQKDIYAYALSKTASKEDAEDITHDTFVQVWKNAAQYKAKGKPLAWIFTIEMNLVRRRFTSNGRFVQLDETVSLESEEEIFTESVINNEFLRQLMTVLREDEREIISLHIVSGLKHKEIAKLLNKPLSTVLSKYNRAIKKLQIQTKNQEEA